MCQNGLNTFGGLINIMGPLITKPSEGSCINDINIHTVIQLTQRTQTHVWYEYTLLIQTHSVGLILRLCTVDNVK